MQYFGSLRTGSIGFKVGWLTRMLIQERYIYYKTKAILLAKILCSKHIINI